MKKQENTRLQAVCSKVTTVLTCALLGLCIFFAGLIGCLVFYNTQQLSFASIGTTGYLLKSYTLLSPNAGYVMGLMAIPLTLLVLFAVWRIARTINPRTFLFVVLGVALAYMLFIVFSSGFVPSRGDALMCWKSGAAAFAHDRDFFLREPDFLAVDHNWQPAVYFSIFPFQCGLVVLSGALQTLLGEAGACVAFRLLNVAAILFIIWSLGEFARAICDDDRVWALALVFGAGCWPLLNHATYTYGNWVALGLVFGFMMLQLRAMQASDLRQRLLLVGVSLVPLSLGLMLKATHILFAIAAIIAWVIWAFKHRQAWALGLCVGVVIVAQLSCVIPQRMVENAVDLDFGEGMPRTSWIEMGLNQRSGGRYVSEVSGNYAASIGADGALEMQGFKSADEEAAYWLAHPLEAVPFFINKLMFEWSEPSFDSQSFYLSNQRDPNIDADGPYARFLIVSQNVMRDLYGGVQVVVLVFAVWGMVRMLRDYVRSRRPEKDSGAEASAGEAVHTGALLMPASFFAGVGCFLLWEAQTIYVLPAWCCLLPLAAYGADAAFSLLAKRLG